MLFTIFGQNLSKCCFFEVKIFQFLGQKIAQLMIICERHHGPDEMALQAESGLRAAV